MDWPWGCKESDTAEWLSHMVFPIVMYRCDSWTIKKVECWRRLLRVPGTARRSSQSMQKEINPGYSLKGLMLKLKLQYFDHLMWRADSLEKTPMLGKTEGKRRRRQQRMRWLNSITTSMDMNLSKLWAVVEDRGTWCAASMGLQSQTWLSNWTTTEKAQSWRPCT